MTGIDPLVITCQSSNKEKKYQMIDITQQKAVALAGQGKKSVKVVGRFRTSRKTKHQSCKLKKNNKKKPKPLNDVDCF